MREEEGAGTDSEREEEGGREASRLLREGEKRERVREWVVTGGPYSGSRIRSGSCSLEVSRKEATKAWWSPAAISSLYAMEVEERLML